MSYFCSLSYLSFLGSKPNNPSNPSNPKDVIIRKIPDRTEGEQNHEQAFFNPVDFRTTEGRGSPSKPITR